MSFTQRELFFRMRRIEPNISVEVIKLLKTKNREIIVEQFHDWSPMMWHAARFTAQAHGIAPLLYKILAAHQVLENLDKDFRNYISDQYTLNSLRIEQIQQTLRTILNEANIHNISVMPLKGSILINSYYPDPFIRPMADIDLLIYPEDKERLGHLLESMKYKLLASYHHKVFTNVSKPVSFDGEHPENPIKIELHHATKWPIGHLKYEITDVIWEKGEYNFLGFSSAFAPARERLLLMLICHIAGNQFNGKMRTFHLYDISLVTRLMENEQWSELRTLVKEYGLERIMFSVLTIAQRFTEIDLPDNFIEQQKWNTPIKLQHHVQTQSLESLIASHEYKLLTLKLKHRSSNVNPTLLRIYQLLFIAIVQSSQFKWFFFGKEKKQEILHSLSPSAYMKDEWGVFMAYIIYWFVIPFVMLPVILIGTHNREKILGRLKLTLIRYLYDSYGTD